MSRPGRATPRVYRLPRSTATSLVPPLRPTRPLDAAAHDEEPSRRPNGQQRRTKRLLEPEICEICSRGVHPDAVEWDLCRVAPAADDLQLSPPIEQAGRDELRLRQFVP